MIVDIGFGEPISWLAAIVFAGALAVTHLYFRHRSPDLFALSCCVASVCVVVTFLVGKLLFEVLDDEFVLILIGGVIIAVVSVAARWLMHVAGQFREAGLEEAVV